jgi:hypothetical protein
VSSGKMEAWGLLASPEAGVAVCTFGAPSFSRSPNRRQVFHDGTMSRARRTNPGSRPVCSTRSSISFLDSGCQSCRQIRHHPSFGIFKRALAKEEHRD